MADVSGGSIASGAASGALAGASFGPYGMIAGAAIGIGLQIYGGSQSARASAAYTQAQVQQAQLEMQVNQQKRLLAGVKYNRDSVENMRNAQKAQSVALSTATNQGAQFGSGLSGGQAQISGEANWNQLGLSQNFSISNKISDLNDQISQARIAAAYAGQDISTAQGISSLGTSVMGVSGQIGRLSSGFGNQNPSGGGTPNYPTNSFGDPIMPETSGGF